MFIHTFFLYIGGVERVKNTTTVTSLPLLYLLGTLINTHFGAQFGQHQQQCSMPIFSYQFLINSVVDIRKQSDCVIDLACCTFELSDESSITVNSAHHMGTCW